MGIECHRLSSPSDCGLCSISSLNVSEVVPMKDRKLSRCVTPLAIAIIVLMLAGTLAASAPKEAVLHHFRAGTHGAAPYGRVISDAAGNLYGTTAFGGTSGCGHRFKLSNDQLAASSVLLGKGGTLYGTTIGVGMDAGAVFEIQTVTRSRLVRNEEGCGSKG
jgi:hypothetical protein